MKYRPQHYSPQRKIKWWLNYREYAGQLNWQVNHNDRTFRQQRWPRVYRIGQHLHYLACHAPMPVRSRWRSAWRRFNFKYRKF